MKIDLHCHSMHSKRPSLWIMQKIGCPESFTHPFELYRIMTEKGMTAVTITDHNVIDGCLEIAHLPNTFISDEVTTYFPEDRCKIHVLVYDISESQFQDIQELRPNIFELVEYLDRRQIMHVLAHPFFGVNDRLTIEHVEQLMLLFKNFELNGDQNAESNRLLEQTVASLTPETVSRLADKHGIEPRFPEPWIKYWTGGSDDHSSLHLASTYTEVEGAETLTQFWRGIEQGRSKVRGTCATPELMAHNIYGIAYQFYKSKLGLERYVNKDTFLKFLDRSLQTRPSTDAGLFERMQHYIARQRRSVNGTVDETSIINLVRKEAEKLIAEDPRLMGIVRNGKSAEADLETRWFEFTNQVSNKVLFHFGNSLLDRFLRAQLFDIFASLGSAGALYTVLAPYFVSYALHTKTRRFAQEAFAHFAGDTPAEPPELPAKIAHFTDTYYEVNGVAKTLQQHVHLGQATGKDYTIITCDPNRPEMEPGLRHFRPVGTYALPEYPEQTLVYPPFLEMLAHCHEAGYTHLHSATPGPVGLAALAIARILKLPISGTYHTALPQYALYLTDNDGFVEEFMWRFMVWYYEQMDVVYVPSRSTGDELIAKGISASKVCVYPRGIDIEKFHPSKRNGILASKYGVNTSPVFLYVGRVSREKNLHLLAGAFRQLSAAHPEAQLLIVGDGPYLEEMKATLNGLPAVFTGYLSGEDLTGVYASSDVFVFPSTTDTFGNVVLEAQASGLPVIVTDMGGPHENVIPGETGLVVPGNNEAALCEAIQSLLTQPARRKTMANAARRYAEGRSFEAAFEQTWNMFTQERAGRNVDIPSLLRVS